MKKIMGDLNNYFFPYSKRKKVVISLVLAHKGTFKNIVFQSALILFLFSVVMISFPVWANQTSVEISASTSIKKGSEVVAKILISHKGNTEKHFTEWVKLSVNGKEIALWSYSPKNLPPGESFTLEKKIIINEDSEISAEGSCNLHGSAGLKKLMIKAVK
jgi:desulfoferrodoxin (superoxide reductase-like protein)